MTLYSHWSTIIQIGLIDKELSKGVKARVAYSYKGNQETLSDWAKDKIPFSNLKTRKMEYIVKNF